MRSLEPLIASLSGRPDVQSLLGGFVPPARFAEKSFDNFRPQHPSQARARDRLAALAAELREVARPGWADRLRARMRGPRRGGGVYIDGGFGVGKTHLLAALWHAAPFPKAYLSFDELVHFIGLVGVGAAREAFASQRLAAIDEWELDDPGNLKLALAFLRGALEDGVHVVTTSNTLPIELGEGRFSQKDFRAEIEELAGAFEVVRVEGDDFRHRHFEADPGRGYFLDTEALEREAHAAGERALRVRFEELVAGLRRVHPIRFAGLVDRVGAVFVDGLHPFDQLSDALRWVHFVDTLYDSAVPFGASSSVALGELFPASYLSGPYGKKFSRCLSRMEELLAERQAHPSPSPDSTR